VDPVIENYLVADIRAIDFLYHFVTTSEVTNSEKLLDFYLVNQKFHTNWGLCIEEPI